MRRPLFPLILAGTLSYGAPLALANQAPSGAPSLPDDESPGGADDLETQLEELRIRLAQSEEQMRQRSESPLSLNGYVDFGYFVPRGNDGIGWVPMPGYAGYSWAFGGDIFSTMINTRGDVADLGNEKAPGMINRFDSVNSDGAPGFILNEFNLRLGYQLSERVLLRTSVNFVPRSATADFAYGDFVDMDLAEAEWVLTEDGNTSVFVGKTLPVFGIEYKERKSDQRFGITPSLMQRYTSGPQLGIKARSKLLRDFLILAAAVSNNSSTTETFQFSREIDRNSDKTLSGRAALSLPLGGLTNFLAGHRLELGASYLRGRQDRSSDDSPAFTIFAKPKIEFLGFDLQYLGTNFQLKAQVMKGEGIDEDTDPADKVWGLDLNWSGYVEADYLFLPWLGAIVRAEQRDAFVTLGTERAYITKSRRYTAGARVVFSPRIVLKAEYILNREYGETPTFKNDMFTSSLVLGF